MADKALYFDGVDDKVEATSAFGDVDFKNQAFTIEFWAKLPSDFNNYGTWVCLGCATGSNFSVYVSYDGVSGGRLIANFHRSDGGTTGRDGVYVSNAANYVPTDDTWFYVAITHDGSGDVTTTTTKIYINGVERQDSDYLGSIGHHNQNEICLGECSTNNADLKGTLEEVHISNIERSSSYISDHYNGGAGKYITPDANSYWLVHLDDETSPTDDASSQGNDGTVTGATWVTGYAFLSEVSSSDTGSGVEALLSRAYILPETGAGLESLGSRLLGAMEEGEGAETLLARLMVSTETASGVDAGGLFFTSGDVGSGLDAILALEARLTGADSGSGIDTAYLIKILLSTDSGLGTEAVAALLATIVAGELMVGSDRLVVKIESAPMGGGMRLPPGGKTSIPSRRVSL